jgi:prophage antirepressor-like protein
MRADDVAKVLGVSKPYAYKLAQRLNEELKRKNYITISGRVSRRYFQERIYGLRTERERSE